MSVEVTHELTMEGEVRCMRTDIGGALERLRGSGKKLYVTWRPDEVTCLRCQRSRLMAD